MVDTLHTAALPFPTPQGTQAAIHQMLEARWVRGKQDALYCYAHANAAVEQMWKPGYPVVRVSALTSGFVGSRSERSGPSWFKVMNDVVWAVQLLAQIKRLSPKHIVAHHVEAACVMVIYGSLSRVFFSHRLSWTYGMHTALALELPTYFKAKAMQRFARKIGYVADRWLVSQSPRVLAISPWLRKYANKIGSGEASHKIGRLHFPFRWSVPLRDYPPSPTNTEAGAHLLYIGNLDKYQNIESLLNAVVLAHKSGLSVSLRIVTAGDSKNIHRLTQRLGLEVEIKQRETLALHENLQGITAIVIPRTLPGGIPVKALDALRTNRRILLSETLMGSFEKGLGWRQWTDRFGCVIFDRTAQGLFEGILRLLKQPGLISELQWQARQAYLKLYYG